MSTKTAAPAVPLFGKILRDLGAGGLTYADVLTQLERLLESGTSPVELKEMLRRRERIEPLPEYAHAGVLSLLNDAIARNGHTAAAETPPEESDAAPPRMSVADSGPPPAASLAAAIEPPSSSRRSAEYDALVRAYERSRAGEAAAVTRVTALAAELAAARAALAAGKSEAQAMERVSAEQAVEAARQRAQEALHEAERHQAEARSLHDALAARDARLAALTREHAKLTAVLEARVNSNAQLEAGMQTARARVTGLAAELAAARAALEAEQSRTQELDRALAESGALTEAVRSHAEEMLRDAEHHQAEASMLREALAARDAELASLQSELDARDASLDELRLAGSAGADLSARGAPHPGPEPTGADGSYTSYASYADTSQLAPEPADNEPRGSAGRSAWRSRVAWSGVALVLLAAAVWLLGSHRTPVPAPLPPAASPPPPPPAGTTVRDCPTCPVMTILPTGRFKQGSAAGEGGAAERPLHWVLIERPFAMSANAVTVDEFSEFVAASGRPVQGCEIYDAGAWKYRAEASWKDPGFPQGGANPATCVSWHDAQAYTQWLSAKTGHHYRLPSASEWEYAARAGAEAAQPWNRDGTDACANANVADQSAGHRYPGWKVATCDDGYVYTAPVGSFKSNSFGLNDMLGNVFQWTEDCWSGDYTHAPIDGAARTDGDCSEHELRGGSWFTTPAYVRANYRNHFAADYRTSSVGIRLVRDIDP